MAGPQGLRPEDGRAPDGTGDSGVDQAAVGGGTAVRPSRRRRACLRDARRGRRVESGSSRRQRAGVAGRQLTRGRAASVQRLPLAAAGTRARLSFYPPGLRQPAHSHQRSHVSIVIAGTVREVSGTRDEIAFPSTLTVRPYEITHQVEFGPQGAMILSVDVEDAVTTRPNSWNHCNLSAAQRTLLSW